MGYVENVLKRQLKMNKSGLVKYSSLKPHGFQLFIKITLKKIIEMQLFYDLLASHNISSSSAVLNEPLTAPGP